MKIDLSKFLAIATVMAQSGCIILGDGDTDSGGATSSASATGTGTDGTDGTDGTGSTAGTDAVTDGSGSATDGTGSTDAPTTGNPTTGNPTTDSTTGGASFMCTDGTVIPGVSACDEIPDCPDNSDEVTGCGLPAFKCADGKEIDMTWADRKSVV